MVSSVDEWDRPSLGIRTRSAESVTNFCWTEGGDVPEMGNLPNGADFPTISSPTEAADATQLSGASVVENGLLGSGPRINITLAGQCQISS